MVAPLVVLLANLMLANPSDSSPRFVVDSTAPESVTGIVESWKPDGSLTLRDGAGSIAAGALVSMKQVGRSRPPMPGTAQVILANGDRMPATVVGGDSRSLKVKTPFGVEPWTVPLSTLAAVWLVPPPAELPTDPARYPWRESVRRSDVVLYRNGDTVAGTVEGFTDDGKSLRITTGKTQPALIVSLAQVAAVAFDPTLSRVRKPKGPYSRFVLRNGSRLCVHTVSCDGTTLLGTTLFGTAVSVPLASLVAMDVEQGPAVYLSDLKPTKSAVEPFNFVAWPWQPDRTVKGLPLRLAGSPDVEWFDKGLGTHPKTTLTYPLAGKYRRFEAVVGLDPITGRRGSARVQLLVDGVAVPVDGLNQLTSATSPILVRIPVAGAKELTLIVDFGPTGDVQADVNWGNAKLIE